MFEALHTGGGAHDAAMLVIRVVAGLFFTISGFHKLFNKGRHASLVSTLQADKVPFLWFNQWFVPTVEFGGGLFVALGFLSSLAAAGLIAICLVATCVDGLKRIAAWAPIDRADWVDDLFYLPEVLYLVMLAAVVMAGPGAYSLHRLL